MKIVQYTKEFISRLFISPDENNWDKLRIQFAEIHDTIRNATTMRELLDSRKMVTDYNIFVKKVGGPPWAVYYASLLTTLWNEKYKHRKLRGDNVKATKKD